MSVSSANQAKPEYKILYGRPPVERRLVFSLGGMMALEQHLIEHRGATSLWSGINWRDLKAEDVVLIIWACLNDQAEGPLTVDEVAANLDVWDVPLIAAQLTAAAYELVARALPAFDALEAATADDDDEETDPEKKNQRLVQKLREISRPTGSKSTPSVSTTTDSPRKSSGG